MKTTGVVVILSFLVFVLSANRPLAAPEAVRDIEGKEVIAGAAYHILHVKPGFSGVLTTSFGARPKRCPEDVVLRESNSGKPVTFFPVDSNIHHGGVVQLLTDLNIHHGFSAYCRNSLMWMLDEFDQKLGRFFVTTSNVNAPTTLRNRFKIEKVGRSDLNHYKFVFCPSVYDTCGLQCVDFGICYDCHGLRILCLSDQPLEVFFVKDNSTSTLATSSY